MVHTLSITYSLPTRNSCTSTLSLMRPTPFLFPRIRSKATSASSNDEHKNTSSVPADMPGFTTHLNGCCGNVAQKVRNCFRLVHASCLTALTPAFLTFSPMRYLSRRANDPASPLLRRPKRVDKRSANSTPVSAPGMTAMTGKGSAFHRESINYEEVGEVNRLSRRRCIMFDRKNHIFVLK